MVRPQNWSSMKVALATYIDPLCPVTPACFRWYGWMLPPARGEVEDRVVTEPAARFSEQSPVKRLRGE